MIRKNLHFVMMVTAIAICNVASAQLFIDNAQFFIQSGATVTVQGDVTSNTDIQGTGKLQLKGSGLQKVSMSGKTIPFLEIDNVSNAILLTNARVNDSVIFTNGKILLDAYNLSLGASPAGKVVTPDATKYFVTGGAGKLIKNTLGAVAFTYPVGFDVLTYNPVTITNSGAADSIGVRCLANALAQGTTGAAFTKEVVDASWDVSETTPGGSNLSITANWATADQLPGFNIAKKTGLSYYIPTAGATLGWDLLNSQTAVAVAGTPNYSVTRTGVSALGTFAVGQRPVLSPLLVAPTVFLQGAYNTGTNQMNTGLATAGVIPTTEPYSGITGYTHSGSGGGETVSSATVFTTNSIVDWVFVSLHDATTGDVVSTRAALLKSNGLIVETDGTTPLSMAGNAPGNYYFSVRHRNHLGVRTLVAQNLSAAKVTSFPYNFASGLGQALAPAANAAMTNKYGSTTTTTNYMMWAADANPNKNVRYAGPSNDEGALLNVAPLSGNKSITSPNGYYLNDFNLNGNVKYAGPNNDEGILLNISLLGNKSSIINQATF